MYVHNRPLILVHSLLASTFSHRSVLHLAVRISCIESDHHIRPCSSQCALYVMVLPL